MRLGSTGGRLLWVGRSARGRGRLCTASSGIDSAATDEQGRTALMLYRQMLQAAKGMPTPTRREFVWRRARTEFEASRSLRSAEEIRSALQLAGTQLQTLEVQGPHLTKLQSAMPERFESADSAVGLVYADTSGKRSTRTQVSAPVRRSVSTRAVTRSSGLAADVLGTPVTASQARDPEAEQMRLARRVARMERSAEDLRQQIVRQGGTASSQMVAELQAEEKLLTTAKEQLAELQAEVEERQRRRAAKAHVGQAERLRASPDRAEQARLEEM